MCAPVGLSFDLRLEHVLSASNPSGEGPWSGSPQWPPSAMGGWGQGNGGHRWRWLNAASPPTTGAGVNIAWATSAAMGMVALGMGML